jgi:hypothetical protein
MVVGGSRGLEKTGLVHLGGRLSHPSPEVRRLLGMARLSVPTPATPPRP